MSCASLPSFHVFIFRPSSAQDRAHGLSKRDDSANGACIVPVHAAINFRGCVRALHGIAANSFTKDFSLPIVHLLSRIVNVFVRTNNFKRAAPTSILHCSILIVASKQQLRKAVYCNSATPVTCNTRDLQHTRLVTQTSYRKGNATAAAPLSHRNQARTKS